MQLNGVHLSAHTDPSICQKAIKHIFTNAPFLLSKY